MKRVIVVCFEMFYDLDVSKTYIIGYVKKSNFIFLRKIAFAKCSAHFPEENCLCKMQRFAF